MNKSHLIWDLPIRLFHWLFAGSILASWYTAENSEDYIELHIKLGYLILSLLIFRLIWGFIGPKHARFSSFLPTPKRIFHYLKSDKHQKPSVGHNPLGSLMVFFMLLTVLMQVVSGLFISDDVFSSGPYYGSISSEIEKVMNFIHHNNFDFILAAIGMHITAILFYWLIKKQNLILPMITGKKYEPSVNDKDAISHSKILKAVIIAVCCVAFVYWLVIVNAPVVEEFY